MHGFDFLSDSPKTLIFEKTSNKTNFGGVLTIIYLLIVLILIIIYMVDYAINPKYSVVYTYEHQFKTDNESIINRNKNKDLNPKVSFNLKMGSNINQSHFGVLSTDSSTGEDYQVEFGKDYTENLYNLLFMIFYECNSTSNTSEGKCDLNDDEIERNKNLNSYSIILNYTGQKVDHQNPDSPLENIYIQNNFAFSINDKMTFSFLRWKNIKYTEERGISGMFDRWFGISNEFYGGSFMDPLVYNFEISEYFKQFEKLGAKLLAVIMMNKEDPNNYYDLYSRTKKGIFDPIANICSLALTIYNGFIFIFCGFYSPNYDNYKIIEKILGKNEKPYMKKEINENDYKLELSNDVDKKDALLVPNDDNNNEEKILENGKGKDINNDDNIIEPKEFKISSELHFYDFLFNNFYIKKCCDSNKQNFLNICNEIISKYNSVDYILYNQIKLENLFKDYKWNDPKLNDIQNNKLIMDLNRLS